MNRLVVKEGKVVGVTKDESPLIDSAMNTPVMYKVRKMDIVDKVEKVVFAEDMCGSAGLNKHSA